MSKQESKKRGRPRKAEAVILREELLPPKYDEDMSLVDNLIGKHISFTNGRLARTFTIASVTPVGNDVCVFEAHGGSEEPLTLTCEQAEQLLRKGKLEYANVSGDGTDKWRLWEPRSVSDNEVRTIELTLQPQDGITERDVEETRAFLESKGLLTDRTEDDAPQNSEPKGRKASDIVEDCWRSVSNAFSDMLWDLREHPVRPSLAIEANDATTAMLETLARLAAEYKGMEEGV